MFDAEKVKDECVEWIREFFEKNGKGCNAVVGISGGKDSSIVGARNIASYVGRAHADDAFTGGFSYET